MAIISEEISASGPLSPKKSPSHGNLVFKVTYEPEVEPITAADVKEYTRIDTAAEDTLLSSMITGVRQVAEAWLGRALITQEITATLDWWPKEGIVKLPRPPLIEVISVKTVSEAGVKTVYSADNYYAYVNADPGLLVIKGGLAPPSNSSRYHGGYEIISEHGYGSAAADVPRSIRLGLIEWVSFAYETRTIDREPPADAMPFLGAYQIRRI